MGYTPQLPLQKWRLVQDFVVDCALRVDYAKAKDVREVMLPLTRLALWGTEGEGLPLKPSILLDAATVRRFAATQEKAHQRREYERRLVNLLLRGNIGKPPRVLIRGACNQKPRCVSLREPSPGPSPGGSVETPRASDPGGLLRRPHVCGSRSPIGTALAPWTGLST